MGSRLPLLPVRWSLPRGLRDGLTFAGWTVLIGPVLFSLLGWAILDFKPSLRDALREYWITLIHFVCYGALLFPAMAYFRGKEQPRRLVRGASYLALACCASLLAVGLCEVLIGDFCDDYPQTLAHSFVVGGVISGIVIVLEETMFRLAKTRRESEQRAIEQERERRRAAEARWTSLESRVRPHFLFNTLASIRELMHRDVQQADTLLQSFAELLRFSLDSDHRPLVTLREELEMAAAYLSLEEMRLGARLRWSVEVEERCHAFAVPSLSVLTLVENSVKHSVARRRAGGCVRVTAEVESGSHLTVTVYDDGAGFGEEHLLEGHGLCLLRERIGMLFPSGGGLAIQRANPGVRVALRVPQSTERPEESCLRSHAAM